MANLGQASSGRTSLPSKSEKRLTNSGVLFPMSLLGMCESDLDNSMIRSIRVLDSRMRAWNMNTYMYAPKDDTKHRAYWRELYTVEEVEELQSLVAAAKENDIEFYYALSPGLDIIYSSAKEVATLKRKLEQVGRALRIVQNQGQGMRSFGDEYDIFSRFAADCFFRGHGVRSPL